MDFIKTLKKDMEIEELLLTQYEAALAKYPEGRLNGKRIKGKQYYYQVKEDGTQKYIPKENKKFVIALRTKGILKKAIATLKTNLKWQGKLLQHYTTYDLSSIEERLPDVYSESRLQQWADRWYYKNPYYEEYKTLQTSFGLMVQSKTEMLIAELLRAFGIPFHYDEEIIVRDAFGYPRTYYIDFVIMTPSGKKIYWEHMGKFYEEGYREHNMEKIGLYYDNGIILGDNLIITMEAKQSELSAKKIVEIIKGQILPHFE